MKPYILSTGSYVPTKTVTNDELATQMDTSDEWIYSHTGIKARRIAAPDQATSDLGTMAAKAAMERGGISPEEIDMILVATTTPDFPSFPSTASIIQEKIGAVNSGAMDLSAACTGFVYALETARAFVSAGSAQTVLVIGCEVFSRIINWKDRNTAILFGDGAGAVIVKGSSDTSPSGIQGSILRSEGQGAESLIRLRGGTRNPSVTAETFNDTYMTMDGRSVYNFAVRAVKDVILEASKKFNFTLDEVKWFVPHQANMRIIDATAKRLGIDNNRFFMNIDKFANTSGASIPIALSEMDQMGHLKRGDLVVLVGFGAGLTFGATVLSW